MDNRKLLIIILLLLPIAVISFLRIETNFSLPKKEEYIPITVKLKIAATEEIVEISLEEYVIGVVAAEMPAAFHEEALKAQAIASRTYAVSKLNNVNDYDLINDASNQAHIFEDEMKEKWLDNFELYYNKIKHAVKSTEDLVATYNNEIITTYYFAMSNGYTENSEYVFQESKSYLQSVESPWDNEDIKNYSVQSRFTKTEICEKFNIDCSNFSIEIMEKSESNRVNFLKLNNQEIEGTIFRKTLGLRSTDFTITIVGDYVYIDTKGYGHGVGMSQYGANGMAEEGYNYEEIIKYYYKNVEINNLKNV